MNLHRTSFFTSFVKPAFQGGIDEFIALAPEIFVSCFREANEDFLIFDAILVSANSKARSLTFDATVKPFHPNTEIGIYFEQLLRQCVPLF